MEYGLLMVEAHQLERESGPNARVPDPESDSHEQEDDAHPIVHKCNSSSVVHKHNRIERHSDSCHQISM